MSCSAGPCRPGVANGDLTCKYRRALDRLCDAPMHVDAVGEDSQVSTLPLDDRQARGSSNITGGYQVESDLPSLNP